MQGSSFFDVGSFRPKPFAVGVIAKNIWGGGGGGGGLGVWALFGLGVQGLGLRDGDLISPPKGPKVSQPPCKGYPKP